MFGQMREETGEFTNISPCCHRPPRSLNLHFIDFPGPQTKPRPPTASALALNTMNTHAQNHSQHQGYPATHNGTSNGSFSAAEMNAGAQRYPNGRVKVLTVDEALPLTPITSIVPFNAGSHFPSAVLDMKTAAD